MVWSDGSLISIGGMSFHAWILVALWVGEGAQRLRAAYRLLAIAPKVTPAMLSLPATQQGQKTCATPSPLESS